VQGVRRPTRRETLWIESSALLRILLEGDRRLAGAFRAFPRFATASLTLIEVPRAIARARREERLSAARHRSLVQRFRSFAASCTVAELTQAVRDRAAAEFPVEPIRSLDAIHLAAALVSSEPLGALVIASCDHRIRDNAHALGFELIPADPPAAGS